MPRRKDRWPELCKLVERDDGLPVRTVGSWTVDKLWFWNAYIDITTSAMVGRPEWSAIVYVDLFAGPGVCATDTGQRFPGSALIAANAPKPFSRLLACERAPENAGTLERRLALTGNAANCKVLVGDCNQIVGELAQQIPDRALTLAFIDPEGLHVAYETIETLARRGQVDLLILFPDGMDIVRNVDFYKKQPHSKLDAFLGPSSKWRERFDNLASRDADLVRNLFTDVDKEQLSRLGYSQFSHETMRWRHVPLYRVIYASKHPRGLDFWNKITKRDRGGQKRMEFD
jgi:three-Cys-motif partner protein